MKAPRRGAFDVGGVGWHGKEKGSVTLGGRKVTVEKMRVRSVDGREIPLETYQALQDPELLTQAALERMIHGLSTRNYAYGLEPVGEGLESSGTSKSSVSRRFIAATKKLLAELMQRRLDSRRYVALIIDGIVMAEHTVVAALGIDAEGKKQMLGVWHGATENAAVCKALLSDLMERGLKTDDGILVVIDEARRCGRRFGMCLATRPLSNAARYTRNATCWSTCLRSTGIGSRGNCVKPGDTGTNRMHWQR
jgi:transposase-like protein